MGVRYRGVCVCGGGLGLCGGGGGGVLVMEDGVCSLIVVKWCPPGCPDARGSLPACLVTQMSHFKLGTSPPHFKRGRRYFAVTFNSSRS